MGRNENIVEEQAFASLMEDALTILEEIKHLQSYLEIEAKANIITEYQIFKTLYLKRKIDSCLEKIALLSSHEELEYTNTLRMNTLAQFESLKQVIDTLDMVNRSKAITSIYTKKEVEYIKAYEDNRESDNPHMKQYLIQTRLTFNVKKEQEKTPKFIQRNYGKYLQTIIRKPVETFICIISIPIVIALLITEWQAVLMTVLLAAGLCVMGSIWVAVLYFIGSMISGHFSAGILLRKIFNLSHIKKPNREEQEVDIGIIDLSTACETYARILDFSKIYLKDKNEIKELNSYLEKTKKGLEVYEDYEVYVDTLLLCEKVNPILAEQGVIYSKRLEQKLMIKDQKDKALSLKKRLSKARNNSKTNKVREKRNSQTKVKKNNFKSNQNHAKTKDIRQKKSSTKSKYTIKRMHR